MPFLSRYVKEVLFFNELCEWDYFFCQNLNGILNCKGLDLGEQPSCMKLVDVAVLTHKPLIIHVGLGLKLSFSLSSSCRVVLCLPRLLLRQWTVTS